MIRIGTVWDRTTDVLAGRLSILAGIALALLVAPAVVQAGLETLVGPGMLKGVPGLVVAILTVWGGLALTAVASDPSVTQQRGFAIGQRRLGAGIAVLLVAVVVSVLAALPGVYLLFAAGFDWRRAAAGLNQTDLDTAAAGIALVYFLVYALLALWVSARLVPLLAVVVNERRGLGAFRRAFALTRGATLKLIGVVILYAIVLFVAMLAARTIFGLAFRLVLGPDNVPLVAFIVAIVATLVTAGFSVLQNVFGAQFYLLARDARDGAVDAA